MAYKFHKKRPLMLNEFDFIVIIEILETLEEISNEEQELLGKCRKILKNIQSAREFKERVETKARDFITKEQFMARNKV